MQHVHQCCIVLCCVVLYCVVLCCIVLCCIVLYCIVLNCIVLRCVILYCIVLHCIALYCTVFCCIVFNCIACIVLCFVVLCCIVLYRCNMVRHCSMVDRIVVVCGLVGLVEQNQLLETHTISNSETPNQFRTQYLCDVILSRSVNGLRRFSRKQYIVFAVP